jgi:site-specific DNA recombinase
MTKPVIRKLRCAVYTRKSSEEGLDQEFNSLDAQREAAESYVASQKSEGWVLVPDRYDDGGHSGGTLERPALKRLLADIELRKIDVVVVYKIDRLSRSLMDFAKLVEVFERNQVTFVSVTQSFNTTTSMGRLTLNILLSFAQFEREVIGERIRDKFAASRKKGMWMGGYVPFGYRLESRKLYIREDEAEIVRMIFKRFVQLSSVTKLAQELAGKSVRNRYGKQIDKGYIYKLITNRVYVGDAVHKGTPYPGEHQPIVDKKQWDAVHEIMKVNPVKRRNENRARNPALLRGIIFGPDGRAMTPTYTWHKGKAYTYYVSATALKMGASHNPIRRFPAAEIEAAVLHQIRQMIQTPEIVVATWRAGRQSVPGLSERQVRECFQSFDVLWAELFPAERSRVARLLVERVELSTEGAAITLRTDGLATLVEQLQARAAISRDAA